MTTLTDRYVAEVARRLPERSRDDISREIRATLADMIESHEGRGRRAGRDHRARRSGAAGQSVR